MPIMLPQQQVQERSIDLPGAAPLSDNGLGAVAKGTAVAADQLRAAEVEQQKKRDATAVMTAVSALGDAERQMRATNEARRGAAAYGVTNDTAGWWESEPAKVSANLENEVQRDLFAQEVFRRREISLNAFSTFEARESTAAVNDATDASMTNAINYGAANYNDPDAVAKARDDILNGVGVKARFNGLPPDQREALKLDMLTKLHTNVIENIAETDPVAANAYFEQHKGEIAGSVYDGIQNKLTASRDVTAAQKLADDIWSRGLDETKALAAARAESTGQQREHTLSLLRQQYSDQEQAVARSQKLGVEAARGRFDQGGASALTPNDVELLSRVAPNELKFMRSQTPQERVVTNWSVYDGLLQLAGGKRPGAVRNGVQSYIPEAGAQQEFMEFDLLTLRGDLNANELAKLQSVQNDLRNNVPPSLLTVTQVVRNVAGESVGQDAERLNALETAVVSAVEDEQKRLNRKLTGAEMRQVATAYMMDVTIPDAGWFWFDKTKKMFELTPDDQITIKYNAIPEDLRTEAQADLREKGQEPSERNVVALYELFLTQGNE